MEVEHNHIQEVKKTKVDTDQRVSKCVVEFSKAPLNAWTNQKATFIATQISLT